MPSTDEQVANRRHLEALLERHAELRKRISRALLIALHTRGIVSIDAIHEQARARARRVAPHTPETLDENVPLARRWDADEQAFIHEVTLDHAAAHLTRAEVEDLVNLTRKRERVQSLEEIANLSAVSSGLLTRKVKEFCRLPEGQTRLSEQESISARVALIRRFISDQLDFIGIAKRFLLIRDFDDLVDRIIGDPEGIGLIGGKAGGLLLGASIIRAAQARDARAPRIAVRTPESYYLRSDVIEAFLRHNGLPHFQDQKYKSIAQVRSEYPMILDLFKNADFPPAIVERLAGLLARVGTHPLIVRSSSLLEDRFGTAFAGKYRSVFVCNQGTPAQRLEELLGAIAEVYASTLHPDPISYRRRHNLLDYSENMAVLIQKLVGTHLGRYFLPVWAGVGVSRNLYRRNPRIHPEDGLARIVFGFGTRAVDRVASDFPRMVPLGLPTLRPEVKPADIVRVSQKQADVIDLERAAFTTLPIGELFAERPRLRAMNHVFAVLEHDQLRPLMGDGLFEEHGDLVVTFDRFARSTPYPAFLRWSLQQLEAAYGCPIDIEFAFDGEHFHLLQCRPQALGRESGPVRVPATMPDERRIFSADRDVVTGAVHGIEYVVLIDPHDYNAIELTEQRLGVAQTVRRLNQALAGKAFILMGPGRWGSQDLRMGVRVGYSDVDQTRMLIEIARRRGGYTPEVSFGSHFFQDLVESEIRYLALYPDEPEQLFNEPFLLRSLNALTRILPEAAPYASIVRVIDVPRVSRGLHLNVDMDGDRQEALGYLAPREEPAEEEGSARPLF